MRNPVFVSSSIFVGAFISMTSLTFAQVPTITTFSPVSGFPGDPITITGTNLSTIAGNNIVYFGAVKAVVQSASTTQLVVSCPTGSTYGPISVTVNGLTTFSLKSFLPVSRSINHNASFAPLSDLPTGRNPEFIKVGDIDGDGKPDLIVANTNDNTISIFRNISTMGTLTADSFAPKVDFGTDGFPWSIAFGDIDGDGKPDLAVACGGLPNAVSVFRNLSSPGSFNSSSLASKIDLGPGLGAGGIFIDDLDGDGKPDLATANYYNNSISVFRNTSVSDTISFESPVSFATGSSPFKIVAGDLNGDGKKDLAVSLRGTNLISVFRNLSSSGAITTTSFDAKVDFVTGGGTNAYPINLALGDLDGDGTLDLAVANSNYPSLSIFRGTGNTGPITNSSFNSKTDFHFADIPTDICLGDLDGDRKIDIVMNSFDNHIYILKNTSTAGSINLNSFVSAINFAGGDNVRSLLIGDLDGDTKPDIAATHVAATVGSGVSLFLNETITGIITIDSKVTVFPTIAKNILTIAGLELKDPSLVIYNNGGKAIVPSYSQSQENRLDVDVNSLTPGLYIVRITGERKSFKFFKE